MQVAHIAIWAICALSIGGVLTRARGIGEWIYALGGAVLLALFGLIPLRDVVTAVARGSDVYFFLAGMMVLAELARREGVFNWVAAHAVRAARGSRWRLFASIYGVGIIVTTVLSNDATAVVLTPAVAAAVRQAKAPPLPHLLACAFVANAASFILPLSNPANLVVFAGGMPPLAPWLATFGLPSILAIVSTFVVLALVTQRDLHGGFTSDVHVSTLRTSGRITLIGIAATAAILIAASAFGLALGRTTFSAAAVVFAVIIVRDRTAARAVGGAVSWSVLLLVAGLFVLVEGMELSGLLTLARHGVDTLVTWPLGLGIVAAGGLAGLIANAMNNLPAGLIAGASVSGLHGHHALRDAIAIGIDVGPNFSVTGSLATVLWLIALRRERIEVSAWAFLRVGALVMPPALLLALASLVLTSH